MDSQDGFGHSLALDDGDLVFEDQGAPALRRLRPIAGVANLTQALTLRLLTPAGNDMFNTGYGLDLKPAFTESAGLRMMKELLKLSVVRTLATDRRVSDIREVLFHDDPVFQAKHPGLDRAELREQRRRRYWPLEVTVETVKNQSATFQVRVGA